MLVLTLKGDQKIYIGSDIIVSCKRKYDFERPVPGCTSVVVEAPAGVNVQRQELVSKKRNK